MRIKPNKQYEYNKFVEINSNNGYSRYVVLFMDRWADLMEQCLEDGEKISDCAERTGHKADTDGITGFMYGCAVDALYQYWEYGDELRIWYNKKYDYDGDGVVNPAIFRIG